VFVLDYLAQFTAILWQPNLVKITSLTSASYWYDVTYEIRRGPITSHMRMTLCHDLYHPMKVTTTWSKLDSMSKLLVVEFITTCAISEFKPCSHEVYSIQHFMTSVTCDRSMVFSEQSGFLHQYKWLPRFNWNIVESGVKHHKPNPHWMMVCLRPGLTLEGEEVALWRLTSLSRWSKVKFKSPCNF
jgi:hypothetical protein